MEQMMYFLVIACAMVFGGYLYRRRSGVGSKLVPSKGTKPAKRPRKKE